MPATASLLRSHHRAGTADGVPPHTCPGPTCPIDFQKRVIAPDVWLLESVAGWGSWLRNTEGRPVQASFLPFHLAPGAWTLPSPGTAYGGLNTLSWNPHAVPPSWLRRPVTPCTLSLDFLIRKMGGVRLALLYHGDEMVSC